MSNSLPQLYSYKGQSWDTYLKDMKVTTSQILIDSKDNEESGNVILLPRKDINTYGTCPKMEVFKLMKCNSCNKMLLPTVFKSHREKFHSGTKHKVPTTNTSLTSTSSSSTVAKKKESRIKEKKKKSQSIAPPRTLFPKPPTAPSPTIIANSVEALQLTSPLETVATDQINSQSSQTNMSQKVADKPIETTSPTISSTTTSPSLTASSLTSVLTVSSSTSPSTTSSSSSSSLQTVSPSSNASISNNTSFNINKGCKITPPNVLISIASTTSNVAKNKYFQKSKTPRDFSDIEKQSLGTDGTKALCIRSSSSIIQQSSAKRMAEKNSDPKDTTTLATSTGITVATTSSATCASIFQIGTSPIVGTSTALPALTVPLTTQRVLLTIPGHLSAIQMYSCHPKPLSMPTPVTRRVGGSFILRNQRLEKQKNEIQMAKCNMITSPSYKTFSVLNMHHKPNILKNNPRGSNKIQGVKRTTNDKSISLEHKQSRLTSDVNGFIIHADVSESAETPQNNNCLQKKLTIFNMK